MSTRVIKVRRKDQVASAARAGARALKAGLLVGFPTETVYGVAALAVNAEAMERLRELKSRPKRPFSVHLGRPKDADRYVRSMPETARKLIDRGWPGPITLVLPVGGRLAEAELEKAGLYKLLCLSDMIGLRCPDEPVARAMLRAVPGPVVAPSANPAGAPSPRSAADTLAALDGRIDLLIDCKSTKHGAVSTIVRCDGRGWKILRQGVHDERAIHRLLHRQFVFVCTGNTCRSPMAAGLAKKMLAEQYGCKVSELRSRGVEVVSAGIAAAPGHRASPEAVRAARNLGANISRHRSRKLTQKLIRQADMILCMTDLHVDVARRLVPSAANKVLRLDPAGVLADPIGGGLDVYERTAQQIRNALETRLDEGIS